MDGPILTHPLWEDVRTFVGPDHFRPEWCHSFDAKVVEERALYATSDAFYQETEVYLYHLTACWLEGTQHPYITELLRVLSAQPTRPRLLDYGCGTGLVGTWFLQAGYPVDFADLPSRSIEFLAWRLRRLGLTGANIFLLHHPGPLGLPAYDVVWCGDVLEHLPPAMHQAFLLQLEHLGATVVCTLVDDPLADSQVHYPVDIPGLTAWVQRRRRCQYFDFHAGGVRLLLIGKWAREETME